MFNIPQDFVEHDLAFNNFVITIRNVSRIDMRKVFEMFSYISGYPKVVNSCGYVVGVPCVISLVRI